MFGILQILIEFVAVTSSWQHVLAPIIALHRTVPQRYLGFCSAICSFASIISKTLVWFLNGFLVVESGTIWKSSIHWNRNQKDAEAKDSQSLDNS